MDDVETVAIRHAVETINADFPSVSRDRVARLIEAEHARSEGKPIRDFVPVLVESRVHGQLRSSLRSVA